MLQLQLLDHSLRPSSRPGWECTGNLCSQQAPVWCAWPRVTTGGHWRGWSTGFLAQDGTGLQVGVTREQVTGRPLSLSLQSGETCGYRGKNAHMRWPCGGNRDTGGPLVQARTQLQAALHLGPSCPTGTLGLACWPRDAGGGLGGCLAVHQDWLLLLALGATRAGPWAQRPGAVGVSWASAPGQAREVSRCRVSGQLESPPGLG